MSSDTAPRSRRALLTAGLAAGVATVASALGRPLPAKAASGSFDSSSAGTAAVEAYNNAVSGSPAIGVLAQSSSTDGTAVYAVAGSPSGSNRGVYGASNSAAGIGVEGLAGAFGVKGTSSSGLGVGVQGLSDSGAGVSGISGSSAGVYGASTSGYGMLGGSDTGVGVQGTSSSNAAVRGDSTSGAGVYGNSGSDAGVVGYGGSSVGVRGESSTGVGVLATSGGTALQVSGKAQFSRCGKASVPKNKTYVDITVAGGLTAHSVISATLQAYHAGVGIAAVRANYPIAGKARIYLTKVASTTAATSVGWFVAEY